MPRKSGVHWVHAYTNAQWFTEQTHWGLIFLFRESVCQAWLVCRSPVVHRMLPCCASKRHRCPPFAVSHISNSRCYHLALTSLNLCLATHLPVLMCTYLCLGSVFLLPHELWWVWLTTLLRDAMIDCVKIGVNGRSFGLICDQTLTPLWLNTSWHFSVFFYFLLLYRTLYQFTCPWPA